MSAMVSGWEWSPAPALKLSIGLHILGAAGLIAEPAAWPWILGGVAADHLLLGAAGMMPRSRILGPNLVRLPQTSRQRREIALTFDDGPDPQVTPAVLDLLDRYGARASFFCIGRQAASYPDLVREIVRRGHSAENHSQDHSFAFACYSPQSLMQDLRLAQETIADITSRTPIFFRSPMGLRSPLLDWVLSRLELRHVAWTRRGLDAVRGDPTSVLRRLTRGMEAGDLLALHDGNCAGRQHGRAVVLEVLPFLLDRVAAAGLHAVTLPTAFSP